MDYNSDDSDTDMASGSTKARYPGLKGDRVPRWDAQKTTYDSWWYDMVPYLKTLGLWDTATGANRHWKIDASPGQTGRGAWMDYHERGRPWGGGKRHDSRMTHEG